MEERALLATITWDSTKASGFWDVPSNWIGGVVPGTNDDAVIGTQSVTYRTGTTTVKSITAQKDFFLTGGTLTATTISQTVGTFNASGGTIGSGTFSTGTIQFSNAVSIGSLTASAATSLVVMSNATLQVNTATGSDITFTINGSLTLSPNSTLSFLGVGSFQNTYVDVNGTLTATSATISETSTAGITRLQVKSGGRLIATDSTLSMEQLVQQTGASIRISNTDGSTRVVGGGAKQFNLAAIAGNRFWVGRDYAAVSTDWNFRC